MRVPNIAATYIFQILYKLKDMFHMHMGHIVKNQLSNYIEIFHCISKCVICPQRIPARKLLYSMVEEERGVECGSVQRVFLKVRGHGTELKNIL